MSSTDNFCEQFGPRSGLTKSESKLFDTLMLFLKKFFENDDFEKKTADDKTHENIINHAKSYTN